MFNMKFLAQIAPKPRASRQIGAVDSLLNRPLQRIRRDLSGFFLFPPAAQTFTDDIAGVQICSGLDLLADKFFQGWSQSDFHRLNLPNPLYKIN
jgi:hypothetical protein